MRSTGVAAPFAVVVNAIAAPCAESVHACVAWENISDRKAPVE